MRASIIRDLPTHRKIKAWEYAYRGADLALLYMWHNLINGNYLNYCDTLVMEQVMYYIKRNPTFESDLIQWFQTHEQLKKDEKNNRIKASQ